MDVPLRCQCGHVRGIAREVTPISGFRFVCYCWDCQTFARSLKRSDVLDEAGGTDIFQVPAGRVELTAGIDALRCLRFSRSVLRWYADCCQTPIANTAAGPSFPVVALIHACMGDLASRDDALGRPICRIYEASASGPIPLSAPEPASFRMRTRRMVTILGWWWRGLGRPNPFFDTTTKAPLSEPREATHPFRVEGDRP